MKKTTSVLWFGLCDDCITDLQEEARLRSIGWSLKAARKMLKGE